MAITLTSLRNGAVGCIGFHEKVFKLKLVLFWGAGDWDRASMRTR